MLTSFFFDLVPADGSRLGLLLLDVGAAMAKHLAAKRGMRKQQLWIDAKTMRTMKDICGSVLTMAVSNSAPVFWQQLSERKLEARFGRLRSSFGNSVVSMADYWRASLHLMKSDRGKTLHAQGPCSTPISEEEFVLCSQRAWSSVRRLFSMCTDCKKEEVQSIFEMAMDTTEPEQDDSFFEDEGGTVRCSNIIPPDPLSEFHEKSFESSMYKRKNDHIQTHPTSVSSCRTSVYLSGIHFFSTDMDTRYQ